jgi:hypothetical protein
MVGVILALGCRTETFTDPILGESYQPKNVFVKTGQWPLELRRVAVMPIAYNDIQPSAASGRDTLEPILFAALSKGQRFEIVPVSSIYLKKWTNREKWSASDTLPNDLIQTIKNETGCDAVLFPELTVYSPYSPLIIGWNIKLVSANFQDILWSVEETFDSSDKKVANAARRFENTRDSAHPVMADSRQVLISPRRFGQYTVESLVATIPNKQVVINAVITEKPGRTEQIGTRPK